jgi:hypothetical protein
MHVGPSVECLILDIAIVVTAIFIRLLSTQCTMHRAHQRVFMGDCLDCCLIVRRRMKTAMIRRAQLTLALPRIAPQAAPREIR